MDVKSVCMHNCVRLGEKFHALRLFLRPFWDRSRAEYSYVAHGTMSIYHLQIVELAAVCKPKGGFKRTPSNPPYLWACIATILCDMIIWYAQYFCLLRNGTSGGLSFLPQLMREWCELNTMTTKAMRLLRWERGPSPYGTV